MEKKSFNIRDFIIGLVIGAVACALVFVFAPLQLDDRLENEQVKRDSLQKVISRLEIDTEVIKSERDSISKASDSILRTKTRYLKTKSSANKQSRNENIKYLNTVDSAYINILSRPGEKMDSIIRN